jgi:predicted nucleotidyltransferase
MQRGQPPPLLPLLRSRLQADLLTLVLLNPGKEWTLSEFASRIRSTVSTVQREVVRAEQAGVLASPRVGNTRLVTAARSPLTGPLTELLLRSFGPLQVLAEELADVEGIEAAYIFGSWAARYIGESGRPPADLDVLVIGEPDCGALDEAAQRASDWP